jgi:hypothetical protein
MTKRADFLRVVRSYNQTPYMHQGRLPGQALDCIGVPICASWELGLKPREFDIKGYGRRPDGTLLRQAREHMTQIDQSEMQIGDVLVLHFGADPQHIGVVADRRGGGFNIIHAESLRQRRVIETRLCFGGQMKFVAAFRIPGIE